VALPLLWSLGGAVAAGWDAAAWQALAQEPLLLQVLTLTLWTGLSSTALAVGATALLLCATVGQRSGNAAHPLSRWLAPLLAVPHAAFAIGLVALLAPSGWLLRLLSPWATGLSAPPPWPTTQDPWGLGLIAVLVLKEVPFLLWAALAHLQRPDVARRLQQELRLAHTLGYSAAQAWWRVGWPQLLPRLRAPLLAVLAYGLTVVDVSLIIGPTAPPTLAMLTWQWLQDADPATNAQGAAAAWVLALVLAVCAAALWAGMRWRIWRTRWTRGCTPGHAPAHGTPRQRMGPYATGAPWPVATLLAVYAAVMLALLMGSITGPWPFPDVLPMAWTPAAWSSVAGSHDSVWTTVWLGTGSACAALAWAVAWLEWAPARWQQRMAALWMLPLVLPAVLWVVGLHRLSIAWGLDTTATGLWLAHTLACLPYVLIALQGPYFGFDRRLQQVSATLGQPHAVFLLRVKWPLLRAPLAAALAVGFAVSVAQYLPTLYVGAGRFQTITTEAVTLAAGGQRSLSAAFAWLQWMLPVLVFGLAAWAGKARQWPAHTRVPAQSGHDA
jgi:putative thiamine transport system permease protein